MASWHDDWNTTAQASDASRFAWPDPLTGPWYVQLGWREVEGRMECVAFSIEELPPAEDDGAHVISAQFVRGLPVGQFMHDARQREAWASDVVGALNHEKGQHEKAHRSWDDVGKFKAEAKVSGRPRMYGVDHYRAVAKVYEAAWRNDQAPLQAIMRDKRWAPIGHSTAARWVRECRRRGILGEAPLRGKAGGVLPETEEEE